MKLQYVRSWALSELSRVPYVEAGRYTKDASWLDDQFAGRTYLASSKVEIGILPELRLPASETELFELENTILIHSALRDLNRSQAADDRLWSWLSHGPYWGYMRKRWPVEKGRDNKARYINEHYFLGDSRSLVRHGIARLWWFGRATYVSDATDPYWLTKLLLKTTDARQSVMERQFWRNQRILHPFLGRIAYWLSEGIDLYNPRERFRDLCKLMNLAGGAVVLDALNVADIDRLVDRYARESIRSESDG